ncbi:MAG: hypothetical protein JWN76_247, partial [Chitinophagaceae bacterium]|nr:hypothetical protein [Chitinophagaceae bacterium]
MQFVFAGVDLNMQLKVFLFILFFLACTSQKLFAQQKDSLPHPLWFVNVINNNQPSLKFPSNYYSAHLGFFCAKELQIENKT